MANNDMLKLSLWAVRTLRILYSLLEELSAKTFVCEIGDTDDDEELDHLMVNNVPKVIHSSKTGWMYRRENSLSYWSWNSGLVKLCETVNAKLFALDLTKQLIVNIQMLQHCFMPYYHEILECEDKIMH